ncbi:MAG: hypothetical protein Q9167_003217 [Letrouitia subvulpina]
MSKRMTPTRSTTYYTWSQTDAARLKGGYTPPEGSAAQEQNLTRVESSSVRRMRVLDKSTKNAYHNSVSPSHQDVSSSGKKFQKAGILKPKGNSKPPQKWTKEHPGGPDTREQAVQTENIKIMENAMDNSKDVQPQRAIHDQIQEADVAESETSKRPTLTSTERNPINSLLDTFSRLRENKMTGPVPIRQQCRQRQPNANSLISKDTPSKTRSQAGGNVAESLHQLAPWMEMNPQRLICPTQFSRLPQESNTPVEVATFPFPQPEPRYLKQQQTSTQSERQCFGFGNPNISSTQYPASSNTQIGCDNFFERQQSLDIAWSSGNANSTGDDSFHATEELKAYDINLNGIDFVDHDKLHDQVNDEHQVELELLEEQYEAKDYVNHDRSLEFQFHENPSHSAVHCPNDEQELEYPSEQEDCLAHKELHDEWFHMNNDAGKALPSPSTTDRSRPLEGFLGQRHLPHLNTEFLPSPLSAMSRPWTRESDHHICELITLRDGSGLEKSLAGFWKPNKLY